ncbi:MAG: hypothetical protein AB7F36_01685 [Reyranellaceae bacterium]
MPVTATVTHLKVSAAGPAADPADVGGDDWNASHVVVLNGLGTAAELDAGAADGVADLDAGGKVPVAQLPAGTANGVATLDAGGKIPVAQIPAIALVNTSVVANEAAMLALSAQTGDIAVRTDENKSYILAGTDPATLGDWQELLTPTGGVASFNGRTGAVTPQTGDYAQSNITGLTTADSPQFAALNVGHASDTTVSRHSAGNLAIEGNLVYRAGGTDVPVADGGTGASTADGAATNLGLGTGNSPQFAGVNIGHASDTTLGRTSAGIVNVEGVDLVNVSAVQTLSGKTLTADKQTVHVHSAGTAFSINAANGNLQRCPTSGNATVTLPADAIGQILIIDVEYGGAHSVTWATTGGDTLEWAGGAAPVATSASGKVDRNIFVCTEANVWRGVDGGRNF